MAVRSPGYPAINLPDAIEKAAIIYKNEKRSATTPQVIAEHWGYSATSSGAKLAVAALKKFGLLESVDGKKSGQMKLSDLALRILLDEREDTSSRQVAIKDAALNPELHRELWSKWSSDLPSDATIKTYLVMQRGFNDSSVGDFIKVFRSTISFANLGPGDKISEDVSSGASESSALMTRDTNNSSRSVPSTAGTAIVVPRGGSAASAGFHDDSLTLPYFLMGEGVASLNVPVPLSEKNFDYLCETLGSTLKAMKALIVRPEEPNG